MFNCYSEVCFGGFPANDSLICHRGRCYRFPWSHFILPLFIYRHAHIHCTTLYSLVFLPIVDTFLCAKISLDVSTDECDEICTLAQPLGRGIMIDDVWSELMKESID